MLTPRLRWLLWLLVVAMLVSVWLYPVSTCLTRSVGVALFAIVWVGLIALSWRVRALRLGLIIVTALAAIFFALPGRSRCDVAQLRLSYSSGLKRYEGARYFWGGESPRAIDCSGLVRRGLVDSLFLQGIASLDPGLLRQALSLWWNDCSARDLGSGRGVTAALFEAPSINALDATKASPGDMAVTTDGVHVLAYLGDSRWIEADPDVGRVIVVSVPAPDNPWFREPVNIVRWNVLQP